MNRIPIKIIADGKKDRKLIKKDKSLGAKDDIVLAKLSPKFVLEPGSIFFRLRNTRLSNNPPKMRSVLLISLSLIIERVSSFRF